VQKCAAGVDLAFHCSLVFVDEGAEDWPMLDPLTGAVGYGMAGLWQEEPHLPFGALIQDIAGERQGSLPGSILGSAEKFPQDCVCPRRYWFIWVEVRAYLQCGVGCLHADHAREQPQVVDVACPGRQCLHRKDMFW
jgi:hypothetical protein